MVGRPILTWTIRRDTGALRVLLHAGMSPNTGGTKLPLITAGITEVGHSSHSPRVEGRGQCSSAPSGCRAVLGLCAIASAIRSARSLSKNSVRGSGSLLSSKITAPVERSASLLACHCRVETCAHRWMPHAGLRVLHVRFLAKGLDLEAFTAGRFCRSARVLRRNSTTRCQHFCGVSRKFAKPRPRLKSAHFPATAFGKMVFKAFWTYHSSFCRPTLSWRFKKVCYSLSLRSRATTAFGKLLLKLCS